MLGGRDEREGFVAGCLDGLIGRRNGRKGGEWKRNDAFICNCSCIAEFFFVFLLGLGSSARCWVK